MGFFQTCCARLLRRPSSPSRCSGCRCGDDDSGARHRHGPGDHRRHVRRRHGHPNGERVDVDRPAHRADITADGPARSTCTAIRAGARVRRGHLDRQIEPIEQPGVVDVESHDLEAVIVQLEVECDPGRFPAARDRRGQGPAAPARAGDRRCGRGPGRLLRRPRAGVAQPPVRRPAADDPRPTRPRLALVADGLDRVARRAAHDRPALLRLLRLSRRSSARTCSPTPSSGCSTCGGGSACPVASLLLGPVWRAVSPVRTINAARRSADRRQRRGPLHATPPGWATGRPRSGCYAFVWIELVYPHGTELGPVRLWCAVYVAVMLVGGALFGNTFYEQGRPVRGVLDLLAKLSVWAQRRRSAAWSAARWPTSSTVVVRARAGGRGVGAVRQHGVRLVPRLDAVGAVRPVHRRRRRPAQQPRAARLLRRRRPDLRGRHDGHRGRARARAGDAARTCSRTRSCRSWRATSWPTT